MTQIRTREEVELLKKSWLLDPCWDIEETESFKEYKDDLLEFRQEMERKWDKKKARPVVFCPLTFSTPIEDYCKEDICAWWDAEYKKCSVALPGYLAGQKARRLRPA